MKEPSGCAIFCDDIRYEISNKLSLIGCYSNNVQFNVPAPVTMPSFATLVNILVPIHIKVKTLQLVVELFDGKELIELTKISPSVADHSVGEAPDGEPVNGKVFAIPLQWSPLHFYDKGYLRIRCQINDNAPFSVGKIPFIFPSNDETQV